MRNLFLQLSLVIFFQMAFENQVFAQSLQIKKSLLYDSIYNNSQLITVIIKETKKNTCLYQSIESKGKYLKVINDYIDSSYSNLKRKHKIYEFLGLTNNVLVNDSIYQNLVPVGLIHADGNVAYVTITKMGLDKKHLQKMENDIRMNYGKIYGYPIYFEFKTDFTEEIRRLKELEMARKENIWITFMIMFIMS